MQPCPIPAAARLDYAARMGIMVGGPCMVAIPRTQLPLHLIILLFLLIFTEHESFPCQRLIILNFAQKLYLLIINVGAAYIYLLI